MCGRTWVLLAGLLVCASACANADSEGFLQSNTRAPTQLDGAITAVQPDADGSGLAPDSTGRSDPDAAGDASFADTASADTFDATNHDIAHHGTAPCCPVAKITASATAAIPQTPLLLGSTASSACEGRTVTKWAWTAAQPKGSLAPFFPANTDPSPVVTANVAGSYTFCLRVWDDVGTPSCNHPCTTIDVMPVAPIHIELLWATPNDPDPTDTGPGAGADLDLHFAHPKSIGPDLDCDGQPDPWFNNPFDVFWFNPNPTWDAANQGPTLDLDSTDGSGPENLTFPGPAGTAKNPSHYDVGAHYWNDHGWGPSYATVNIYIEGVLATNVTKVKLQPNDMWHVGRIHWPNTMSQGTLEPFELCRQDASPCEGGVKWQTAGDPCITPCYYMPTFSGPSSPPSSGPCKKP